MNKILKKNVGNYEYLGYIIYDFKLILKDLNFYILRNITLVFAECVFTYIEGNKIDQIIKYFSENFKNIIIVSYEMFNPNDNFG